MARIKNSDRLNAGEEGKDIGSLTPLVGIQNGTVTLKTVWNFLKKKNANTRHPAAVS